MEISQLKYFYEVAKTEHMTKAAEKLHIAQPALTKSIHNLEKELNVPLFSRQGRNIRLTQYGLYLKEKIEPVIRSIEAIPADLAHMTENETHTIRLSVKAASSIVTDSIIEYKKNNPDTHFQLLSGSENNMFDVEISTNLFYNKNENNEKNQFVCNEKIFLAVPKTKKYLHKKDINLSDVKNENFISLSGSKQLREICEIFCRRKGFEPNIIFESDSPSAVKNMIAANLGVGFWPEFSWGEVDNEHVILLPISSPVCSRDIIINYKNIKIDNTYSKAYFEFLKDYIIKIKNCSR